MSLRLLASGISTPTDLVELPDGTLLVAARDGRIFHVALDGRSEVIADLSGEVLNGGERGLLGIALSPPSSSAGTTLYLTYIRKSDGATVLVKAQLEGPPYRIAPPSSPLLAINHVNSNHNGGDIVVLPEGRLIVSTGDSGGSGDPQNAAQDLGSLLGKLLLVDPSSDSPSVRIVARGLRNPWRIALEPSSGNLWIADVGQDTIEEIDRIPVTSLTMSGETIANFGWPILEGDACFRTSNCTLPDSYQPPIAVYRHGPGCSVIGGTVAQDRYLFSDYCDPRIFSLPSDAPTGTVPTEVFALGSGRSLSAIVSGASGRIWLLDVERGEVLELFLGI